MPKDKVGKESKASHMQLLIRDNYEEWQLSIQLLLHKSVLYGFTDETKFGKRPVGAAAIESFRHAAAKFDTTKEVWEHIKTVFASSTRSRKMRLLQELCLIEKKLEETMMAFVDRLDTAAKDYFVLKMTDEDLKTYLLIARCGKEYDQLRLIIDQWPDTDFKWEKVSNALMAEENHHRYAKVKSELKTDESEKVYATTGAGRGKNPRNQRYKKKSDANTTPSAGQATQQGGEKKPFVITCYNCQGAGHIARDCPSPRKPRPVKNESASVLTSSSRAKPKSATKEPPLELGEGFSSIHGIGDIRLEVLDLNGSKCVVTLKSACYAPKFRRNLISLAKLDRGGVKFSGKKGLLKFYDDKPSDTFMYGKLSSSHGLYKLVGRTLFANNNLKETIGKSNLIPGSLAFVHIPAHQREHKHSPRAWKGIMLGYAMGTRGYRIWDPENETIIETKHFNWPDFENLSEQGTEINKKQEGLIDNNLETDDDNEIFYDTMSTTDDGSSSDGSEGMDDAEQESQHRMLPTPVKPTSQAQMSGSRTRGPMQPMSIVDSPLAPNIGTRKKDKTRTCAKSPDVIRERVVTTYSVPNMPGWTKEVVIRQKGVTKGDQDTYFYDVEGRGPMRSYGDIESRCKKLDVPFVKDNFKFESRKATDPRPKS
uniref:CCHC-type domain-containing protein n=1 Tax=Strigamia maritima TaxID=126957 RepID=T1JAE4_STRMM